jgi:hypothetical protein
MSTPTRRQVGRWRLRNTVENHLRYAYADPDMPADPDARVVDCPYCGRMLRPAPRGQGRFQTDPLRPALHDHLFDHCPVVEVRP